jgi:alpha-D-ribose 1-methylphosphonate 5-triphosphate synthase subunit PhnH
LQAGLAVKSRLGFHTGAPLAKTPAEAHFAIVANPAEMMALDGFSQGTQDYPDRSTTLILQVSDLTSGSPLLLEGPGIETTAAIAPAQMPRQFVEQWKQTSQRFPRGVDIILAAPDGIACLPRTTRIKTMEA